MDSKSFITINGIVQTIQPVRDNCCQLLVAVRTQQGIINILVSSDTYVIKNITLRAGMPIVAFYDANAPVPLIFPPQYHAVAVGRRLLNESIMMDYFDNNLVGTNNSLKLNISPSTRILSSNGQIFTCSITNRVLIVYYQTTTRSIPPQTTPSKIIVMC